MIPSNEGTTSSTHYCNAILEILCSDVLWPCMQIQLFSSRYYNCFSFVCIMANSVQLERDVHWNPRGTNFNSCISLRSYKWSELLHLAHELSSQLQKISLKHVVQYDSCYSLNHKNALTCCLSSVKLCYPVYEVNLKEADQRLFLFLYSKVLWTRPPLWKTTGPNHQSTTCFTKDQCRTCWNLAHVHEDIKEPRVPIYKESKQDSTSSLTFPDQTLHAHLAFYFQIALNFLNFFAACSHKTSVQKH